MGTSENVADPTAHLDPVEVGQAQVEDDQIRARDSATWVHGLGTAVGHDHLVAAGARARCAAP